MKKPIISICIPTFNRKKYLEICLDSINKQINSSNKELIEIVVSDDASIDNTKELIKKYPNLRIRYFRNKKNLGMIRNTIKAGEYGKGQYIWYFSDDDFQIANSLDRVLESISKYKPDIAYGNLDQLLDSGKILTDTLKVKKDLFFPNKKSFFNFLSTKFFYRVDWFTTYLSILIMKREIVRNNLLLLSKHKSPLSIFPQYAAIFYTNKDYNFLVLKKRTSVFRAGNTSWGPKNEKVQFLDFWDKTLVKHYNTIYKSNKEFIGIVFIANLLIKTYIRKARLLYEKLIASNIFSLTK